MPEQRHLRLDPAGGREAAKPAGTKHPVTGYEDRDRIRPAGLPDRLGGRAQSFGQIAVGAGFPQRDRGHGPPNIGVQPSPPVKRQVEPGQAAVEIRPKLPLRFLEGFTQPNCLPCAPIQPDDYASVFVEGQRTKGAGDSQPVHLGESVSAAIRDRFPFAASQPSIVSAAQSALRIASSVASIAASKRGEVRSLGKTRTE